MSKYIECDMCHKVLRNDDTVIWVKENASYGKYCGEDCLDKALMIEWTEAETYIKDVEHFNENDDVYID